MKKYWKAIGIGVVVAGALYYPAMKLYKYLKTRNQNDENEGDHHIIKTFAPAYRGKNKHVPHHRHPDGHTSTNEGMGLA